jgi:hypothetical protein
MVVPPIRLPPPSPEAKLNRYALSLATLISTVKVL